MKGIILSLFSFILIGISPVMTQDLIRTRISLSSTQMPDNQMYLQARVLGRVDGRYTPMPKLEIRFVNYADDEELELGKSITNLKGICTLDLENSSQIALDEDGLMRFGAFFEENDQLGGSDDEIYVKQGVIEISVSDEDDEKQVEIKVYGAGEEAEALADYEAVLLVPRMYSDLKIGNGYTDEDGMISFVVPEGMPGDKNGILNFKAKVLDAGDYGNLEVRFGKDWGVPKTQVIASNRELWSPNAPLWMVLTFVVLMLAVWSHFGIIIFNLIKLKKLG